MSAVVAFPSQLSISVTKKAQKINTYMRAKAVLIFIEFAIILHLYLELILLYKRHIKN